MHAVFCICVMVVKVTLVNRVGKNLKHKHCTCCDAANLLYFFNVWQTLNSKHLNDELRRKKNFKTEILHAQYNRCPLVQSPLFLLFLNCVWQLMEQYPAAFEFTEMYLTVLSDSMWIPVFSTFLFNCPRQRAEHSRVRRSGNLLSAS